jgi:hypothetical protein
VAVNTLQRPIFVVGCPRSGTTLVQCILSASSQAFSLPETHFFSWVLPQLGVAALARVDLQQIATARQACEAEAELTLPSNLWADLARRSDLRAVDIFLAVVDHFRPANAAVPRMIEKTPRHVLHMESIGELFQDAVFVNVVRDPVDVASSLQGVPFESSRSMLSHAERWLESVRAAQTFATVNPCRITTVVYEELVREPEAQTRRLCEFVQLPYEARMLEEFGREATRNVGRGEAWKRDVAGGVIMNRQGVWRTRLTPGQAWLVAQTTRGLRREYGYAESPKARAASIAAAIVNEARVRFREARSSTGVVGAARHAGSVLKTLAAA